MPEPARSTDTESGMPQTLNDIERRILDYMVSYLKANTYQPSIREIGERFGIKSTKTVSEHLQALAEKGFLERDPSRSRGVRILGVDLSPDAVSLPCYSALPDDRSLMGGQPTETHLTLDRRLAGVRGAFLVRAQGDELVTLGVEAGDYVLIEPLTIAEIPDNSVVAARPGGGAPGYYRLSRNGRGVFLAGLGAGSSPMMIEDPSRLDLVGRVGGLFRRFDGVSASGSGLAH